MPRQADHAPQSDSNSAPSLAPGSSCRSRRRSGQPWRPVLALALVVIALLLLLPFVLADLQQEDEQDARAVAGQEPAASQPADAALTETFPEVTRDSDGRLQWPRPRIADRKPERDRLVDRYIARGGAFHDAVKDERVVAAMRTVPRHEFVPRSRHRSAYDDTPLPIGHGQTISQPYIVALMTDLLEVKEGDKVLEIGTGSGYQAAVLNELTPYVYSIEIVKPLYEEVVERFERLGYKTIQARLGDGYDGWQQHAPFDGIIVTCAAGHVPPPLWNQLKPGGRMVIPVGGVYETQRLVVLTKRADGGRKSRTVLPVRFVPMTGKIQKP
ncbi:MAG: protein-L-isoaspartate(D-aspartate) O-methyltransferase [Planctomycetes bacterium]|nr:protein-L-isoaspartate(D-aspartate) O-methyltransferase [Planctomycetota bacterium]